MNGARRLVPEVVQTSATDCGPAALKALLEGFGISASYGRLREACQTDVDGTSITDIERSAVRLGLAAEQLMLPTDHLLLDGGRWLPALCVVRLPSGLTHFVVAWARYGRWLQVMDPAAGRRWMTVGGFESELYRHTQAVPDHAWRAWAASTEFQSALDERMRRLAIDAATRGAMISGAADDETWRAFGTLDASIRMATALAETHGIRRGAECARLVQSLVRRVESIPDRFWSVRQSPANTDELLFRGTVLVRVRGRAASPARPANLSPELAAALTEQPVRPGRTLLNMMVRGGAIIPTVLAIGIIAAAASVALEAVLWQSLLQLGRDLAPTERLAALGVAGALLLGLLLLELPIGAATFRLSRQLECRFRELFLYRIPRLNDRYFQSRLASDMAERSHSVHQLRQVPDVVLRFARAVAEIATTVVAIWWLFPECGWLATVTAVVAAASPVIAQPYLAEQEMRMRSRVAAMSRFYLDALLGGIMLRAHGAARSMRREHGSLLREWARAALAFQRAVTHVEVAQLSLTLAGAGWMLWRHVATTGDLAGLLLLAYWALGLPLLGQEAARAGWQYPRLRNIAARLLEPLAAQDEDAAPASPPSLPLPRQAGAAVTIRDLTARAGGHVILRDVNLHVGAGEHVAVVGESGAGKSSLLGLLLGWMRPTAGELLVDDQPLSDATLAMLRSELAWVDPTVQIWNRSLFDNLTYGTPPSRRNDIGEILHRAWLRECVHRLPHGMRSALGESGGLLSGGEGQRVRLARGLMRRQARLVLLDEPGRGLDRDKRREVIERCREHWAGATLLCVTHDVTHTRDFPRVVVVHGGRVVEDGSPHLLSAVRTSRYRAMLDAEEQAREHVWTNSSWRRITVRAGMLVETLGGGE